MIMIIIFWNLQCKLNCDATWIEKKNCTQSFFLAGRQQQSLTSINFTLYRVWKGFCVIRDSAEIERLIREYRENLAVIREFYIGCDAGFSYL